MIPELVIYACALFINYLTLRYHLNLRTKGGNKFVSPKKYEANLGWNIGRLFYNTLGKAKERSGDQGKSSLQTPFITENDRSHEKGKLATYVKDEEEEAAITSIPPSPVEERTRYDDVEVEEEEEEDETDDEFESNMNNSQPIEINEYMENLNEGGDVLFNEGPQISPSQIGHTSDYQEENSIEPTETEEILPQQHSQSEIENHKIEDVSNELTSAIGNKLTHQNELEEEDIQPIDSLMWESFVNVEPDIPEETVKAEQQHDNSFFDNQTTESNIIDTDLVAEAEYKPDKEGAMGVFNDTVQEQILSPTDYSIENTSKAFDAADEDESINEANENDKAYSHDGDSTDRYEIGDYNEQREIYDSETTPNYSENEQLEAGSRRNWETLSLEDDDEEKENEEDEDQENSLAEHSYLEVDEDEDEDENLGTEGDLNKGLVTTQELIVEEKED